MDGPFDIPVFIAACIWDLLLIETGEEARVKHGSAKNFQFFTRVGLVYCMARYGPLTIPTIFLSRLASANCVAIKEVCSPSAYSLPQIIQSWAKSAFGISSLLASQVHSPDGMCQGHTPQMIAFMKAPASASRVARTDQAAFGKDLRCIQSNTKLVVPAGSIHNIFAGHFRV